MLTQLMLLGMVFNEDAMAQAAQLMPSMGVTVSLERRPHVGFVTGAELLLAGWGSPLAPEFRAFSRFAYGRRYGASLTTGAAVGVIGGLFMDAAYLPFGGARAELGLHLRRGPPTVWVGGAATVTPLLDVHVGRPITAGAPPRHLPLRPPDAPRMPGLPDRRVDPETDAELSVAVLASVPLLNPAVEGRPVRHGESILRAEFACPRTAANRHAASALEEYASVLAFVRQGHELRALGAPAALIGRSFAAAREEVGHTLLCLGLAARDGETQLAIQPLVAPTRTGDRSQRLARMFAECVVDGQHNEGTAAIAALNEASQAADPVVATAKERIGREELGHARLAIDIARWAAKELGVSPQTAVA